MFLIHPRNGQICWGLLPKAGSWKVLCSILAVCRTVLFETDILNVVLGHSLRPQYF